MKKRNMALWTAILAPPLIWFFSQVANFALAPWACELGWKAALFAVSIAALILAAGTGLLAYNQWQQLGRDLPGESGGAVARGRAMAIGGMTLSGVAALVIIAQAIPPIVLRACS